jgi:hypothetical protein
VFVLASARLAAGHSQHLKQLTKTGRQFCLRVGQRGVVID